MNLQALSEAVGVSGSEDAVRKLVLEAIDGHVSDIKINALGGVTALKKGTGARDLRVMVAAHMDEIGFIVRGFDSDGLIRFSAIGGIDDRILPGLRVLIGSVPGVILWTPIHLNRDQNVVKLKDLRIDIGATSKDEAAGKVKPGDRIVFRQQVYGDRRQGAARQSLRRPRRLLAADRPAARRPVSGRRAGSLHRAGRSRLARGESRGAGAQPGHRFRARRHDGARSTESAKPKRTTTPTSTRPVIFGGGPALTVMDRSMIADPRLIKLLRETAEAEGIPYQFKTQLGGGTDAGSIHLAGAGVPSAVISMPCRYIHSPTAYLHRDDYDNGLRLIKAVLNRIEDIR